MYKVLIVDDQPVILSGLSNIILWEEYGLQVAGLASNGEEALGMLGQDDIHILITDIKMPKMDGLELLAEARRQQPAMKCVVLSGYDDFQYVKEAARLGIENYLLKPVDTAELTGTLTSILEKLDKESSSLLNRKEGLAIILENTLNRWVSGTISEEELQERLQLLGVPAGYERYTVVIVRFLDPGHLQGAAEKASELLLQKISHPVCGLPFRDADQDLVVLIPEVPGVDPAAPDLPELPELRQELESLHLALKNEEGCETFITAVSGARTSMNVGAAYRKAKNLQDYCLGGAPAGSVLFNNDLKTGQEAGEWQINYTPLESSFARLNREEVRSFLDSLFSGLTHCSLSPSAIRNIILEVLFCLSSTAKKMKGYESTPLYHIKNLMEAMLQRKTLPQLSSWLTDIALESLDWLAAYETKYHPLVKKVLEHVAGHYREDMNLKTLAYQFGVTPVYLGHLFLKETGETFTNHLNTVRAEKAKILLKETSLSIKEISLSVGYVNTKYFSSVFSKVTGVNPSEYRP